MSARRSDLRAEPADGEIWAHLIDDSKRGVVRTSSFGGWVLFHPANPAIVRALIEPGELDQYRRVV